MSSRELGIDLGTPSQFDNGITPAGWFLDPGVPGHMRWWDGRSWTTSFYPVPLQTHTSPRMDAATDLAAEQRAGNRARIALIGGAAAFSLYFLLFGLVLGLVRQPKPDENIMFIFQGGALLFEAALLVVGVLFLLWMYKAASIARRAGLEARWNPIFGIFSFIIPVLNYVVPYQCVRDTLPPGHRARRSVRSWWGLYLAMNIMMILIFVGAGVSVIASVIAVTIGVFVAVAGALSARQMICQVNEAHAELLLGKSDTSAVES